MEEWKNIKNYEGIYQVSNYGRIKNQKTGRIRKLVLSDRYYEIVLSKNGRSKLFKVHRLVAEAFVPNPLNKKTVNHLDNNHLNNCVDNLVWATQQENVCHTKHLIYGPNTKTKNIYIQNEKRKRKSGEEYIYYRVMVRRVDCNITKGFKYLSDAIEYRNKHLKEWLRNEK